MAVTLHLIAAFLQVVSSRPATAVIQALIEAAFGKTSTLTVLTCCVAALLSRLLRSILKSILKMRAKDERARIFALEEIVLLPSNRCSSSS